MSADKLGPVEIVFHLDKQADEQAKKLKTSLDAVETSSGKIRDVYKKLATEASNSSTIVQKGYTRQIGLIADMEKALTELREKKKGAFTTEDIEKYNKRIQEAELHLKEYNSAGNASIEVKDGEEKAQNRIIGTLGKWAIGLVTVTGLMKLFKGIMESTTTSAHIWETKIEQAKSVLEAFMKMVATADFSNFNDRIRNAASSAKMYVEEMEFIVNVRRQYRLQELGLQNELSKQREIAYQNDTVSIAEKKAALDKVLSLIQQKADLEIEIAQKTQEAIANKTVGINKITKEELVYAVENYDKLIAIGQKYNALTEVLTSAEKWKKKGINYSPVTLDPEFLKQGIYKATAKGGDFAITDESIAKLKKQIADLGPDAQKLADIESKFGEVNTKEREAVFSSLVAIKEAMNEVYAERRLIVRRKSSLENEEMTIAKQAKEDALNLEKQIAEQTTKLQGAIASGNKDEIKTISDKIVLLKKELDIRIGIANAAILAAYGGAVPRVTNYGKAPTLANKTSLAGLQQASVQAQAGADLGAAKQWNVDDLAKDEKKKQNQKEILEGAMRITYELGKQLGISEEELQAVGSILDAFQALASGNYVSAAVSLLSMLIQSFPTESKKFTAEIERLNVLIERQQKIIEQSARIGGTEQALVDKFGQLKEQEKALQDALHHWASAKVQNERIDKLNEVRDALNETEQALNDFLSGDVTQNTLADTITQAFKDGTDGIDYLANYTEKMLTEAVLKIFNGQLLGEPMNQLTAEITEALSDKILTSQEKQDINNQIKVIADANKQLWNDLTSTLNLNPDAEANQDPLKGSIKGITEKTADVLAGQGNAVRIGIDSIATMMRQQLLHSAEIAANTRYNKHLESIDNKLDALSSNSLRAVGL